MTLSNGLLRSLDSDEAELRGKLSCDVKEIFTSMVGLDDLQPLPVQLDPVTQFKDCISSLVGLGGTYNGLVSLHMPSAMAIRVAGSMLDMNVTELNEEVNDALGEIANMIAGSFKQHLSRSGLDITLSTPSVIYGKEFIITLTDNPYLITSQFMSDDDWFMVAVTLEEN